MSLNDLTIFHAKPVKLKYISIFTFYISVDLNNRKSNNNLKVILDRGYNPYRRRIDGLTDKVRG